MVRPVTSDFLHNMRFHVAIVDGKTDFLVPKVAEAQWKYQAGFTSCSIPELTIDPVEYKEGQFVYPRKYPGAPAVGNVTLQRGVTKLDCSFWYWARTAATGNEYRVDLQIKHYHRENTFVGGTMTEFDIGQAPGRIYKCMEAFATRCKPAGDLDATSADISIMELDIALEQFVVLDGSGNAIAPDEA